MNKWEILKKEIKIKSDKSIELKDRVGEGREKTLLEGRIEGYDIILALMKGVE